jgi:hypothetical protein
MKVHNFEALALGKSGLAQAISDSGTALPKLSVHCNGIDTGYTVLKISFVCE